MHSMYYTPFSFYYHKNLTKKIKRYNIIVVAFGTGIKAYPKVTAKPVAGKVPERK